MNAPRQNGVALITAILLVAIATILAAKLTWDNQINMRRTEASLMQEQARFFALGAEALAIDTLVEDTNSYDNYTEQFFVDPYAEDEQDVQKGRFGPAPIDIDGPDVGVVQIELRDAQGKLNLNNLIIAPNPNQNPPTPAQVDEDFKEIAEQLFVLLDVDPAVLDAIVDWLDPDTVPQGLGAEDEGYTALNPGYRTANGYIASISELRAVAGVTPEIYDTLVQHVTAIPPTWCGASAGNRMLLNANFATPEVLAAVPKNGGVSLSDGENWAEIARSGGWETDTDLPQELQDQLTFLGVQSKCLELKVTVNVGVSLLTMYSLIDRSGNNGIVSQMRAYGLD